MLVHCRLTPSSMSLVGMRGRRLRRKGRGRDFEIIALDNETARLEPRLHKVVIGKNTFSFLSTLTDTLVFPFQWTAVRQTKTPLSFRQTLQRVIATHRTMNLTLALKERQVSFPCNRERHKEAWERLMVSRPRGQSLALSNPWPSSTGPHQLTLSKKIVSIVQTYSS